MKRAPAIEPVMPLGVFVAYVIALASIGLLFVLATTGGLVLG